jgi:hypothetical protein
MVGGSCLRERVKRRRLIRPQPEGAQELHFKLKIQRAFLPHAELSETCNGLFGEVNFDDHGHVLQTARAVMVWRTI